MSYQFNGFHISERMLGGIRRYVEYGVMPGDFLRCVLSNDLKGAVANADRENMENLPAYVGYMVNEMPEPSQGSLDKMLAWAKYKRDMRHERVQSTQEQLKDEYASGLDGERERSSYGSESGELDAFTPRTNRPNNSGV
jgi:hypothetical protein